MRVAFLQLVTKLAQREDLFKTKTSVVCCKPRQHVSRSKSWERAHQQTTALHFTSLAYWPRPHATAYFDRRDVSVKLLTIH